MKELIEGQLKKQLEIMNGSHPGARNYEQAAEAAERLSRILKNVEIGNAATNFIKSKAYWA